MARRKVAPERTRDSRNTLSYRYGEGAHPGNSISNLGSHIGDGNSYDGVIAKSDDKGYHDHGEGDTLLRHAEGGAAQREKDKEQGESQPLQAFGFLDKSVDSGINGAGFHDNSEGAAYHQNQGADSYGGAGTVAGYQAFKYIV